MKIKTGFLVVVALIFLSPFTRSTMKTYYDFYPPPLPAGQSSAVNLLIDATAEAVCFVVIAPKTGTLGKVAFRTGTVTTGDTVRISFEDINNGGLCDESADQYRDVSIASTDDNLMLTTGLVTTDGTDVGGKRSVTRGDLIGVRMSYPSWVAGNLNIANVTVNTASTFQFLGNVYIAHKTTSWTKQTAVAPQIALIYDDDSVAFTPGVYFSSSTTTTNLNSGSTPDEIGNRFIPLHAIRAIGAWVQADIDNNTDLVLYDSSDVQLFTVSLSSITRVADAEVLQVELSTSSVTLTPGSTYRITMRPSTTTNNALRNWQAPNYLMESLENGTSTYYTSRTNAGAWTDDSNRRTAIGIVTDQADDGTGGTAGVRAYPFVQ